MCNVRPFISRGNLLHLKTSIPRNRGSFFIGLCYFEFIKSPFCINSEANNGNNGNDERNNVVYDFHCGHVVPPILCISQTLY